MGTRKAIVVGTWLLFMMGALPARPQDNTVTCALKGVVTKNNEPAADMRLVLTSPTNGRQFKTKTDKQGKYFSAGMALDVYKLQVLNASGEILYTLRVIACNNNSLHEQNIDLGNPEASGGTSGDIAEAPRMTKEQEKAEAARLKAYNDKIPTLNALLNQAQTAIQAQKWADAEKALKQLIAANPETTRWEFYKALGDAQSRNGELQDAIKTYDTGIQTAQAIVAGKAPKDPGNPNPDPARAKAGIGQMLISEGNVYVKLEKPEMAAPLFQQATLENPNPGLAYYNLCALQFNANKLDEAIASCDKAIAADPTRADAWFLKGAALYKGRQAGTGKAGPDTIEALNKYLQLDPNGAHAAEAKTLLAQK